MKDTDLEQIILDIIKLIDYDLWKEVKDDIEEFEPFSDIKDILLELLEKDEDVDGEEFDS